MVHSELSPLVIALKTITLALGGLITYFSYKAYRRTGAGPLRMLAIGFAFVTLGSLLAGVADVFIHSSGDLALVIESALTAVGFGIIVYSLYAE